MKLHTDPRIGNTFTAYGSDYVAVNGVQYHSSMIVQPESIDTNWHVDSFAQLTVEHIAQLAATGADIVILGTGKRQHFPHPSLLRPLIETGRTLEPMDTAAACRTYNILMSEGRLVAVALIIE